MKVYIDGMIPAEMTEEEYNRLKEQEKYSKEFAGKTAKGMARKLDEEIMKNIKSINKII